MSRNLFAELVGARMWACRRAGDMATFQFGRRNQVTDFFDRAAEIGDYALHVQCAWRIVQSDAVFVGSGDLYYPADARGDDAVPGGFDWDHNPNRRDRLLTELFQDGTREFAVSRIDIAAAGACSIEFQEGIRLELFPDDSLKHEQWRLFEAHDEGTHMVIGGSEASPQAPK